MTVTAGGTAPLAYQWFKDGRLLLGVTNSTLIVANAGVTNTGSYSVVVTNANGMTISLPASVAVGNPLLLAWGNNANGQLGNGTTINTNLPVTVASNVVVGAIGADHSLFVTTDGKLWAMGWNQYGQLGNSLASDTNKPVSVASNVLAVAAGFAHSLFVKTNGTLWAMGYNRYGQLGNGASNYTNPAPVSVASNAVAVAAGENHSLFVKTNGTLWAMGNNQFGQLGNGTTSNTNPVPVSVASNVVAVAAGQRHSLFVTRDGTLWTMGNNQFGQLGNGTTNDTSLPVSVASNVVAGAAGVRHSLFITADGTLWAMGYNRYGQLGNGTTNDTSLPVSVASNIVAIAAGTYHSLFVKNDGTIWTMGLNGSGQLGNGTTINTNLPVNVSNLFVAAIFKTDFADHSIAIGVNRSASVTLGNLNQAYTGSAINVTATTLPAGLTVNLTYNGSPVAPTNCGSYAVIGTISDSIYNGSATNTLLIAPSGPTNQILAVGDTMSLSVAAGTDPTQTYQWFKDGRLLLGATNSTLTAANAGVTDSGTYYAVLINANGMAISLPATVAVGNPSLLAWGFNSYGELGNGTTGNSNSTPITVASNVVMGTAGQVHSLFVKSDGTLWAMGNNQYGQLGNGTTSGLNPNSTPIRVSSNAVAVAAGQYYSLFVRTNGVLWAMGDNSSGQLGNGTTSNTNKPVNVISNVGSGGGRSVAFTFHQERWDVVGHGE